MGASCLVSIPSTLQEAVELFGEKKILDDFVLHHFYSRWNVAFRKKFASALQDYTEIPRPQLVSNNKPQTDKYGRPVLISEMSYANYLLDQNLITHDAYQSIAQRVANTIDFVVE